MPGPPTGRNTPEPGAATGDASRYDIVGRLADGAMGQVYLARITDARGQVFHLVLKRIRPELQNDADMVLMFQDEARIAAQMEHPNIVRLFEVGELDGSLFLSMELVVGVTLEHLLTTLVDRRRFAPVEVAVAIASAVLSALDYAHQFTDMRGRPLNIVHRDISPQNVMVSYAGGIKLLDFGITRAEGRLHQTLPGLLKGKLAYMAPETIEGRAVDARADLFSLGSVLYELLLLKHPFFGSTDAMVLRSIVEEPPVHPSELDPNFPEALADILLGALAKDPDHRIQSAAQMRTALETFLQTQGFDIATTPKILSAFLGELYADRIELHAQAKQANDDALLLQALRGSVRRPSDRLRDPVFSSERTPEDGGQFGLPHSAVQLDYARVPTADLPVLKRDEDANPFQRSSMEPLMDDAFAEATPSPTARPLMTRLGRFQLLEVLEQSSERLIQRARMWGPYGFTKEVCLHRLPPDRVDDPEWIGPFVHEAKVRADLNHPHIEALVDFDEQPEVHFVVEPLQGVQLDQLLTAAARGYRSPMRIDIALRIVVDVIDALEYMHGLPPPILHRNVEPGAVHLHQSGRAKLSSFNLARRTDAKVPIMLDPRRTGVDRLAPELVDSRLGEEGPATDVYGVTLLLAECLSLTRPFLRDAVPSTTQAILHGFDEGFLQDLPTPLRPVVRRGLAVSPAKRFPDVASLRAALSQVGPIADRRSLAEWSTQG